MIRPEQLDLHSFRRGAVCSLKRESIPNTVGMRLTGHSDGRGYDRYDGNAGCDDCTRSPGAASRPPDSLPA